MKRERILWVDVLKGILIFSVVIGHATGKYNAYIYQFHMAAFFMVSGYTTNHSSTGIFKFIYDRFIGLLLPFFTIFASGVALSFALNKMGIYHWIFPADQVYIGVKPMLEQLLQYGNNYVWWMGACWFVPVLFGAACVQKIFSEALKNDWWRLLFSAVLFLYALSCNTLGNFSVFPVRLILIAQLYLLMGELARKHKLVHYITNRGLWFGSVVLLVLIGVFVYVGKIAGITVDWPSYRFSHPVNMIVIPACDTLLFGLLSYYLAKWLPGIGKWIAWFGQNSFPIMVFHFLMFKIGNGIMVLFRVMPLEEMNSFLPPKPNAEAYWVVYVLISCVCSVLLWKMLGAMPIIKELLGKNRKLNEKIWVWGKRMTERLVK